MTNFLVALVALLSCEGGITNDENDPGGFTYAGISCVYHPEWQGWKIVKDEMRRGGSYKWRLSQNTTLYSNVAQFYYLTYWQPLQLDRVPDENIRIKLFGIAVHIGPHTAIKALQYGVSSQQDGIWGYWTSYKMSNEIMRSNSKAVIARIETYQRRLYADLVKESPKKKAYQAGWIARVEAGL